jgi:hypothetical protein
MLTVADVREHLQTDLPDGALERLLDAAYAEIERVAGPAGTRTVVLEPGGRYLVLPVDEGVITAVREDVDGANLLLAADDWRRRGTLLERLATGTNPRPAWAGRVSVTLDVADDAVRDRVALALVLIDVQAQPGLTSQQIGEWRETYAPGTDLAAARREVLASLIAPIGVL